MVKGEDFVFPYILARLDSKVILNVSVSLDSAYLGDKIKINNTQCRYKFGDDF